MSDLVRKYIPAAVASDGALTDRQVRVIASSGATDRVGDIVVPGGCRLDAYRKNPIVLADHDSTKPVGTAAIEVKANRVEAVITFAPAGASEVADRTCALVKSGVLNAVSVGFLPLASEPIRDKSGRQTGVKITDWELTEISIVAVPANAEAVVIARGGHSTPAGPDYAQRQADIEHAQRREEAARLADVGLANLSREQMQRQVAARLAEGGILYPSQDQMRRQLAVAIREGER